MWWNFGRRLHQEEETRKEMGYTIDVPSASLPDVSVYYPIGKPGTKLLMNSRHAHRCYDWRRALDPRSVRNIQWANFSQALGQQRRAHSFSVKYVMKCSKRANKIRTTWNTRILLSATMRSFDVAKIQRGQKSRIIRISNETTLSWAFYDEALFLPAELLAKTFRAKSFRTHSIPRRSQNVPYTRKKRKECWPSDQCLQSITFMQIWKSIY